MDIGEAKARTRATAAALDAQLERIAELGNRIAGIRSRRPSASGVVIPEVDIKGRLTDLYLAPGTAGRLDSRELAAEIVGAIRDSVADARRQYLALLASDPWQERPAGDDE